MKKRVTISVSEYVSDYFDKACQISGASKSSLMSYALMEFVKLKEAIKQDDINVKEIMIETVLNGLEDE